MIALGLCQCGCGEKTAIASRSDARQRLVKGQPKRFVSGHQNIGRKSPKRIDLHPNTTVHCACGCGQLTKVALRTNSSIGDTKGKPRRFIHGHFFRTINVPGAESPGWKGGVRNHNGYVYIHKPEHPNADSEDR
jgi:hypothetical protein